MNVDEEVAQGRQAHRAQYILERGTWRGTCRICGWQVTDGDRRRATAMFRQHCQEVKEAMIRASRSAERSVAAVTAVAPG